MTTAILAVAAGIGGLAGCAGDEQEAYCETVATHQATLGAIMAEGRRDALIQALPAFTDLADRAPRDLRDEWRIVIRAVTDLRDVLDDAGVDPASYDAEEPPPGLDEAQRGRIETAAARLASRETVAALAGVEQHALDVCGTPLGL